MFCDQCGQALQPQARFCSQCGSPVATGAQSAVLNYASTEAERFAEDEPILVLRPTFLGWVTALSVLPLQLFMTVWAGGFCGGFSTVGLQGLRAMGLGAVVPTWFPFVFFASLAFLGIPFVAYFAKKRSYAKTEYRFYPNRLEYYEGFFTIDHKTVLYRNVSEVQLRKGVIQKRYGLGTIVLSTPAQSQTSGIKISDIEGAADVYEQVKTLVREAR